MEQAFELDSLCRSSAAEVSLKKWNESEDAGRPLFLNPLKDVRPTLKGRCEEEQGQGSWVPIPVEVSSSSGEITDRNYSVPFNSDVTTTGKNIIYTFSLPHKEHLALHSPQSSDRGDGDEVIEPIYLETHDCDQSGTSRAPTKRADVFAWTEGLEVLVDGTIMSSHLRYPRGIYREKAGDQVGQVPMKSGSKLVQVITGKGSQRSYCFVVDDGTAYIGTRDRHKDSDTMDITKLNDEKKVKFVTWVEPNWNGKMIAVFTDDSMMHINDYKEPYPFTELPAFKDIHALAVGYKGECFTWARFDDVLGLYAVTQVKNGSSNTASPPTLIPTSHIDNFSPVWIRLVGIYVFILCDSGKLYVYFTRSENRKMCHNGCPFPSKGLVQVNTFGEKVADVHFVNTNFLEFVLLFISEKGEVFSLTHILSSPQNPRLYKFKVCASSTTFKNGILLKLSFLIVTVVVVVPPAVAQV